MGRAAKMVAARMAGESMRGGEMRYESEYRYAMEPRHAMTDGAMEDRTRDSRGRFRSEMTHPTEHYPSPVYEKMNTIGFAANSDKHSGDLHMMRTGKMGAMFDEGTAHEWMNGLQREDDAQGPIWTIAQIKQAAEQRGIKEDPMRLWVAVNAMYADYCAVAKKYGVDSIDFFLDLGKAFLDDKDSKGDKLSKYYYGVVK